MSPLSVAQYLDPKHKKFDIVIFDEASQITTSDAVGAIARGKSAIIVGDEKQLPPTRFFEADTSDEDDFFIEDGESVLSDCLNISMPKKYLTWHYRSKDESLIAFSNVEYYDNKLLTFPSPKSINSSISFRYCKDGIYEAYLTMRSKNIVLDNTGYVCEFDIDPYCVSGTYDLQDITLIDGSVRKNSAICHYDKEMNLIVGDYPTVQFSPETSLALSVEQTDGKEIMDMVYSL